MKIRNGFVSNSSSSSFVLFGIELNEKKIDDYKWLCENFLPKESYEKSYEKQLKEYGDESLIEWTDIWYENMEDTKFDIIHDSGNIKIGKQIASSSDSELDNGDISLEEIIKLREELKDILPNVTDKDFKLFYGSYYC